MVSNLMSKYQIKVFENSKPCIVDFIVLEILNDISDYYFEFRFFLAIHN